MNNKYDITKHAVVYNRFSPRPNADECKSNEQQEERCRKYCSQKKYVVEAVYTDEAISGEVAKRDGLEAALNELQQGWILVVDTSDRLARDMLVNLTIRYQIQKLGCTIEFADGSPLPTSPEGELFQNILAAFADYERKRFARRTKEGLARKKQAGQWIGRPPYGFEIDKVSKRLIKNEREQKIIESIKDYDENGKSSEMIAQLIEYEFGYARGRPWSARTIRSILAKKTQEEE